ncbi:MAG: hypothetical protein ACK41O_27335 [Runella zeae]
MDPELFSLHRANSFVRLNNPSQPETETMQFIEQIVDGIFSVIVTMVCVCVCACVCVCVCASCSHCLFVAELLNTESRK